MSTHRNTVEGSVPYSGMPNNVSAASRAPHSWLDKLLSAIFHNLLASDLFKVRSLNAVVEWLCSAFVVYFVICDWASENGPSGDTKFDHIFQIYCIIANDLLKLYKWNLYHQLTISQATFYNLLKVNIVPRTQNVYHFVIWCFLCPLGPFLLAQSHIPVKHIGFFSNVLNIHITLPCQQDGRIVIVNHPFIVLTWQFI